MGKGITRRDFLKGMAAGAASISLFGCSPASSETMQNSVADETEADTVALDETTAGSLTEETKQENSIDWTEAADVIIVGGGGAGFCAAIEAGRAGADVLILEKSGICGGDSLLCGGMIMAGGTQIQKSLGIEDTTEAFVAEQLAYLGDYGDAEMVREMAMASPDEVQFMIDLGRNYEECHLMPPAWEYDTEETWARRSHANLNESPEHFLLLQRAVDQMDNARYYTNTEVANLLTNDAGEVIGVKTADGRMYRANKGVVLSTASFGRNKEMCRRYNPMGYWALDYIDTFGDWGNVCQSAKNTGDGIRMAQEIGADLALSPANCVIETSCMGQWFPEGGKILVNKDGKRFVQENANWGYVHSRVYQEAVYKNDTNPETAGFWIIMDSNGVKDCGFYGAKAGFAEEHMVSADTLEELAEMVNLPADNLLETVNRWNGFCDIGEDLDFKRRNVDGRNDMMKIETGPFYAARYFPVMLGSFGGVRTNIETQVIHVNGEIIPRLYAAGSTMSGMYVGSFYPACGWSILGTVHWGRKAGKHAAGLAAWTSEPVTPQTPSEENTIAPAAGGSYNAGTYTAVGQGRNGEIAVTVEFSDTEILSVEIGEHAETAGISDTAIKEMPGRIIAAQSVDIDVVSGVTMTSQGILDAVKDCIAQASK